MFWLMVAALVAGQDAPVTAQTVDAHLQKRLGEIRREIGRTDHTGMTITGASLSGRTLTIEQRYSAPMSLQLLNTLEQGELSLCDEDGVLDLVELGVKSRTVYTDPTGARFTLELSQRTCDGPRIDSSDKWRVVRSTRNVAAAVDTSTIITDAARKHFEMALIRPATEDRDVLFGKEIYEADCSKMTYIRHSSVIYDDQLEVDSENTESTAEATATAGSSLDHALRAVCSGSWPNGTDRNLEGFVEVAMAGFKGD